VTYILIVIITLKPEFLALSNADRETLLADLAAPIQEFTGQNGGVFFSQRVAGEDDSCRILLAARANMPELFHAFLDAMQKPKAQQYAIATPFVGPEIGIKDLNDPVEVQRATQEIFSAFLD
jgi:hypothetical protein